MNYCQKVHDLRQCPVVVGSPQTQTQRDQVTRIISIAQGQALRAQQQLQQQQQKQQQKQQLEQYPKFTPTKFTFDEASQLTPENEISPSKRNSTETVEIVNLSICLGGWVMREKSLPLTPAGTEKTATSTNSIPGKKEMKVNTEIQDIDIIIGDEISTEIDSSMISSSCFYFPRIASMNTNNKTPPPSPTNPTPTTEYTTAASDDEIEV